MDLTAHLNKEDIVEIVKEHLQAKYSIKVEDVQVNQGYQFHGIDVRFGEQIVNPMDFLKPTNSTMITQYTPYMIPISDPTCCNLASVKAPLGTMLANSLVSEEE